MMESDSQNGQDEQAGSHAHRLIDVVLADGRASRSPQVEQERKVAIFDLLEENYFKLIPKPEETAPEGPYKLHLNIEERHLQFNIQAETGAVVGTLLLSLSPFRKIIKDYFMICESYFEAIKTLPAQQIEAIDMGRRGIHNEGAVVLQERLKGKIEIDNNTARRLFTLVSVLHYRG